MRRAAIWMLLCAATMGAVAASSTASPTRALKPAVSVRPGVGGPHARFVVSFRAVAGRISSPSLVRHYTVTTSGPRGKGCASSAAKGVYPARLGQLEHVRLSVRQGFCRGTFHGRVTIVLVPVCSGPPAMARPTIVCPMFVVDGGIVGRFSFRVR